MQCNCKINLNNVLLICSQSCEVIKDYENLLFSTEHISSESHQIMLSNKLLYSSSYKRIEHYSQEGVTHITCSGTKKNKLDSF